MTNEELAYLNRTTYLRNNINTYMDIFISFYGEDNREFIKSKFTNSLWFTYQNTFEKLNFIYDLENKYTKEFLSQELEKVGLKDNYDKYFKNFSLLLSDLMPINTFKIYYEQFKLGEKGREDNFIIRGFNYFKMIKPDITLNEYMSYIKKEKDLESITNSVYVLENLKYYLNLDNALEEYKEIEKRFFAEFNIEYRDDFVGSEEFKEFIVAYRAFDNALERFNLLEKQIGSFKSESKVEERERFKLEQEYYQKYVRFNYEVFSEEEKQEIDNYFNDLCLIKPRCLDKLGTLNGTLDEYIPPLVKASKMKFYNQYHADYIARMHEYQNIQKEREKRGLLNNCTSVNTKMYYTHYNFVTPDFVWQDGKFEIMPLMFIYMQNNNKYMDHAIIHELNHVLEMSLLEKDESYVKVASGWDIIEGNYEEQREDKNILKKKEIRHYEMFNEVINEMIAKEISLNMERMGICIFNDYENHSYDGFTSYEKMEILVSEFYNDYKNEIIASRRNGNIDIIYNKVGKENFDKLNMLCIAFSQSFNDNDIRKYLQDLKEGVVTDRIKKMNNFLEQRDIILSDMREFSNTLGI